MLTNEMIEQMKSEPRIPDWTKEEQAFRRGYCQGFWAAKKRLDVTFEDVKKWRYGSDHTAPPGSGMEGVHLHGLTNEDPHRFFINNLKKLEE